MSEQTPSARSVRTLNSKSYIRGRALDSILHNARSTSHKRASLLHTALHSPILAIFAIIK